MSRLTLSPAFVPKTFAAPGRLAMMANSRKSKKIPKADVPAVNFQSVAKMPSSKERAFRKPNAR